MIGSDVCFGLVAYFTEGKYSVIHGILIYACGTLWLIDMIWIAALLGNSLFSQVTDFAVIITAILTFGALFIKKVNVFVQSAVMLIWYGWLILLVFHYL
jgi:hypothetical protein